MAGDGAPLGTGGVGTRPAAASSASRRKTRTKVRRRSGHGYMDPGVLAFAAAAADRLDPVAAADPLDPAAAADRLDPAAAADRLDPAAAAAREEINTEAEEPLGDFVKKFYEDLNSNPHSLYLFYAKDALFRWTLNGLPVNLKSAMEIEEYLSVISKSENKMEFFVRSRDALHNPRLNCVLLMVNGTCQTADKNVSAFVQSFSIEILDSGVLILNDCLRLLENGPGVRSVEKAIDCCGICKKPLHHGSDRDLVRCDCCGVWLDLQCVLSCGDMQDVKNTKYTCPDCRSGCEVLPALQNTSSASEKELPKSIPVFCCGKEAVYSLADKMMSCQCGSCVPTSLRMTPSEWEKHTGSRKKNWKLCVKVKGTDQLLHEFLLKLKSSSASESHHTSTTAMLKNKSLPHQPAKSFSSSQPLQSPTADCPGPKRTLRNKAGKLNVCILEDNDVMSRHKSKDKAAHESPFRVLKIMDKLKEDGVLDRVVREPFESASRDVVLLVHDEDYLPFIDSLPMRVKDQKAKFPLLAGKSLFSSKGTSEAVYKAAGAVIRGAELVVEEYYEKAFAIIRPPGHHAGKRMAEGFCYLNNLAIAVKHVLTNHLTNHDKKRILLVDFDVHHGNGTQEIFYDSNEVLFFSVHRTDLFYPDSDMTEEFIGEGAGRGYNVNVPMDCSFGDKELYYIWKYVLIPLATAYSPEMVFVSAGYDAGQEDRMGGCTVSPKCFGTIVHQLSRFAGGKMVLGLEGGYHLTQLPIAVSYTIRALLGDEDAFLPDRDIPNSRPNESAIKAVRAVKERLRPHWPGVFK